MLSTVKNKNNTKVFITRPAQNKEMIEEKKMKKKRFPKIIFILMFRGQDDR
jgi:hypothetical protein